MSITASVRDLNFVGFESGESRAGLVRNLLPIVGVVFVAYLIVGLAMAVLPFHVHEGLGMSTFVVGLVAGSQFAASLLSRPWAGFFADTRGGKASVTAGLLIAVGSGAAYLTSLQFVASPIASITVLVVGRMLLGLGESLIITGALSWGLRRGGKANNGKVMSWVGTAIYAAYAVGAPVGTFMYLKSGFVAISIAATLIPLVTLLLVIPISGVEPSKTPAPAFGKIFRTVLQPGLGLAISGVGFASVTTFVVLLFDQNGWGQAWLALTILSVAFMAGRLFFGHLPDRNGAMTALICICIEALGLAAIWLAPVEGFAFAGVILVGLGYSLVYPGLGVEALRRSSPENRGLTMGAFTAFLDLSLGLSSPALGLVANAAGLRAVFLISSLIVLGSAYLAFRLLTQRRIT